MTLQISTQDNYDIDSNKGIGEDSLVLTGKHFVLKADGVVSKAVATGVISGVNYTEATFASDNESVAKAKVEFEPAATKNRYQVTFSATIAETDEESFYDLVDSENVDTATKSATTGQVQLIQFVSATEGIVTIANA